MSATNKSDYQVAALAAGFTLGFGFLTCWEAIKHTQRNRNPLRSPYIYMIWGEIIANLILAVLAWLFLDGILPAKTPTFFFILLCWVFEIQLLMQIIINRIAIIAESQKTITRIRWATFAVISCINIAVFCIFIPAHTSPPASALVVKINSVWDRMSKFLIMAVDAVLNWYFLRTVNKRLLKQSGLTKYKPLVTFTAKLMILSILMDVMLIGLMWLPNQTVFIQFHPVTYIVKLNIEMSMASLILKLAQSRDADINFHSLSYSRHRTQNDEEGACNNRSVGLKSFNQAGAKSSEVSDSESDASRPGANEIHRKIDFKVTVEGGQQKSTGFERLDDEMTLTQYPGHPLPDAKY
ncbi:hypothetical protein GGR56DRAFT_662244 [Xylariaceae sp. FL0804]|nr:hypothetical protein GGR56DRAFT_662244 [Xylariaceae sp. FL0804]